MKTFVAKFTFASFALGIAACASAPRAPIAAIEAPVTQVELAADEEAEEEFVNDCRQELGLDSGDADRAHVLSANEWISGCFVNGDDVDGFAIVVPSEASAATYQIELVHRGGAALETALLGENGEALASAALVEGTQVARALTLEPGSRTLIRVAKQPGAIKAWYRIKASPVTQVAAK